MPQLLTTVLMGMIPPLSLLAFRGTVPILAALAILGAWALGRACLDAGRESRAILATMTILLGFGGLTEAWAAVPFLALSKALSLVPLCLGGLVVFVHLHRLPEKAAGQALTALVVGMAAAALFNAVDVSLGGPVVRRLHALMGTPIMEGIRVKPAKAAATLFALWGLPAALLCWQRRWRVRAALALGAALLLLWTAHSSTGLVALAGGIVVVGLALAAPRSARLLVAALLMAGFGLAPLAGRLPDSYQIAQSLRFLPPSALHRTAIWKFTGQRLDERPWLGWGLDGARSLPGGEDDIPVTLKVADRPHTPETNCLPDETCIMMQQALPLHPHNFILQIWVELGLFGAILSLALVLAILFALPLGGMTGAAALGGLATGLGIALTGYGIWQAWWLAALWLGAGVCALGRQRSLPES